jgi:hypothetical protein
MVANLLCSALSGFLGGGTKIRRPKSLGQKLVLNKVNEICIAFFTVPGGGQ